MTKVSSTAADSDVLAYDALGRVTKSQQQTGGKTYLFQGPGGASGYEYNLADQLLKQYMPSGRLVETAYTLGGKPSLLKGKLGLMENVYAQEM